MFILRKMNFAMLKDESAMHQHGLFCNTELLCTNGSNTLYFVVLKNGSAMH